MLFWAILELAMGLGLFLVPTQITGLFGIQEPTEVWIRAGGVALVGLGAYHLYSALGDDRSFYRTSVPARLVMAAGMAYLAIMDGPWQLWIFAIGLTLGATWTFVALRNTGQRALAAAARAEAATEAAGPDEM
jgi:hypothetical protein